MRIDRDQLTFKALCALHEVGQQAKDGPIRPTFALRFLLAYLYAVSDAPMWLIKQIWRELQQPNADNMTGKMATYVRETNARTALHALARHCGQPLGPRGIAELDEFMRRNGTPEQRGEQALLDAIRYGATGKKGQPLGRRPPDRGGRRGRKAR